MVSSVTWQPSFYVKLRPCHPDIYKTAFLILSMFNLLDTNFNSQVASIFSRNSEKYKGHGGHLFCQIRASVTLIASKLNIQYTGY